MALNAATLSDEIKTNLKRELNLDSEPTQMNAVCKAIAEAVVSHITANATVIGEVSVVVATGAGAIVPGTGKIE